MHQAVEVYTDMGRLNMAARQLKEIGEAQEKQGLKEEAITFYSQVGPAPGRLVSPGLPGCFREGAFLVQQQLNAA